MSWRSSICTSLQFTHTPLPLLPAAAPYIQSKYIDTSLNELRRSSNDLQKDRFYSVLFISKQHIIRPPPQKKKNTKTHERLQFPGGGGGGAAETLQVKKSNLKANGPYELGGINFSIRNALSVT